MRACSSGRYPMLMHQHRQSSLRSQLSACRRHRVWQRLSKMRLQLLPMPQLQVVGQQRLPCTRMLLVALQLKGQQMYLQCEQMHRTRFLHSNPQRSLQSVQTLQAQPMPALVSYVPSYLLLLLLLQAHRLAAKLLARTQYQSRRRLQMASTQVRLSETLWVCRSSMTRHAHRLFRAQ